MKEWVIPAPAPWANTKHARASAGRIRSAETVAAFPTAISSFCGLTIFISLESGWRRNSSEQLFQGEADRQQPAIAAGRPVQFHANRQCTGFAQCNRDLKSGDAGIAAGIGVLNVHGEIRQIAGVWIGSDRHLRHGGKYDSIETVVRKGVAIKLLQGRARGLDRRLIHRLRIHDLIVRGRQLAWTHQSFIGALDVGAGDASYQFPDRYVRAALEIGDHVVISLVEGDRKTNLSV